MNKIQKLVYEVCGYNPLTEESGARNAFYYECSSEKEKLGFLLELDYHAMHLNLNCNEIFQAYRFLESEFSGSNQQYHAFKDLV
jgi:hypothetical protein